MPEKRLTRRTVPAKAQKELARRGIEWRPGDTLIRVSGNSVGQEYRVGRIYAKGIEILSEDWEEPGTWTRYHLIQWDEWDRWQGECVKVDEPIEELEAKTLARVADGMTYYEGLVPSTDEHSDETAIVLSAGKESLQDVEHRLQKRRDEIAVASAIMERKMLALRGYANQMKQVIERVQKVIGVLELYLGVNEEILQIRQGTPAGPDEPICIRQMLLYMDEEVGDPRGGGLDFKSISSFDEWVCRPENTEQVISESKGVVAIRPRRYDKWYSKDPWVNSFCNAENKKTYLLIRNGDNLYRIWMPVTIGPRLFPTRKEYDDVVKTGLGGRTYKHSPFFSDRDREDREFDYKKYGVMLQGLIMRTQALRPIAHEVDLFDESTWNSLVRFIRDDEMQLPTGRLPWQEFQKKINSAIDVGSRIVYYEHRECHEKGFMVDHVTYGYYHVRAAKSGLYTVGDTCGNKNRFLYNPGDTPWRRDWEDTSARKRRVAFKFYDDEVLNFDLIDLQDLEFYVHNRVDREHYGQMLGILYLLRDIRSKELDHERALVTLLVDQKKVGEQVVWDAVRWWKLKNRWKRPVSQDDSKAYRMVKQWIHRNR